MYGNARSPLGGWSPRIVHANSPLPGTYTVYFSAGTQSASDTYTVT